MNTGITHLVLPPGHQDHHLPFYLAMEEWAARRLPPADYFFTWRVNPTVIFGRNQKIDAEVDTAYCSANGIEMYRRRSGGGCVYADKDNIMLSYITPGIADVATTFRRYTESVAAMLRSLGISAEASGRNDVTVDSRKVSGGAFYRIPGRSIAHSTMLWSTNLEHMLRAITPSRSKLEQKHVQSVQARITTLDRYLPGMTIEQFDTYAISCLTHREMHLTETQVAEIREIERPYYDPAWIYGRASAATVVRSGSFPGVGHIEAEITVDRGVIADVNLTGDYFLLSDLDSTLLCHLRGIPLDPHALAAALAGVDVSQTISGLDTPRLLRLLTE